jgi:hypothetical protein
MSAVMSKKKPGRPKSATPPKERILAVRMPPDLETALESFRAAHTFPPDRTAVALRALENFLREQGHYPPRKPS